MIAVKQILVATDFGSASEAALRYGAALANTLGATLHLVHVVDDIASHDLGGPTPSVNLDVIQDELDGEARDKLAAAMRAFPNVKSKTIVLRSTRPATALLDYAKTEEIDLIVAGTHGRTRFLGLLDFFMGSVAQNLVRNAPCPVMTMRGPVAEAA